MKKPRVLCDVDGVLADFVGFILDRIYARMDLRLNHEDVDRWDIFKSPKLEEACRKYTGLESSCYDDVKTVGACLSIRPLLGAREGIAKLQDVADVYFITSPFLSPTWCDERSRWLAKHFGVHHTKVGHFHHKHIVSGDIMVDDKYDNLMAWKDHHPNGTIVLWETPHNRGQTIISQCHATNNWGELLKIVERAT